MKVNLFYWLLSGATASFLRVESGHQNVQIEGRDPYLGYFTRLLFTEETCIQGVTVHCLVPLTGAEEIDLLYTECPNRNFWQVAHYSNTKEQFSLTSPIWARQLSVTSRQPLSIVDIRIGECEGKRDKPSNTTCWGPSTRKHRHHKTAGALRVRETEKEEKKRRKRSASLSSLEYSISGSPYRISENITVSSEQSLTIHPGVHMLFDAETGIFVYGNIFVNGTKEEPIYLEPSTNSLWKGIYVSNQVPSRSSFSYVNISSSEVGITVTQSILFPLFDHVISDGNKQGFTFDLTESSNFSSPFRVFKASAVNSGENGFFIKGNGKV